MTMMIRFSSRLPLTVLVLVLCSVQQQQHVKAQPLVCTMKGTDESTCVKTVDSQETHCVWCSYSGIATCVSEQQAEIMEKVIPSVACDRYAGDDDDDYADDDEFVDDDQNPVVNDDDATPSTDDDGVAPTDDAIPDDFWKCLKAKSSTVCAEQDDCTWCNTKAGFGICLSGPAAESAKDSDWFTCDAGIELTQQQEEPQDPYDPACFNAYMQEQTEEACVDTLDATGQPCMWCSVIDVVHLCLTGDQAQSGAGMGITCNDQQVLQLQEEEEPVDEDTALLTPKQVEDPYDTSCLLAYLEDQSPEACKGAQDMEGNSCEYCELPGLFQICLTAEQAEIGESTVGLSCDESMVDVVKDDPYDTSCLLAYLEDQSPQGCKAAQDEDGNPCEFCELPGLFQICLTEEQAEMAESTIGLSCDATTRTEKAQDPYDTSCLLAYLEDQSPQGCKAAQDMEGNACEFCELPGLFQICLTEEQAEMAESTIGLSCDASKVDVVVEDDPFDTSCLLAYLEDQSPQGCKAAQDEDGNSCEFCELPGLFQICLTEEQAEMAESTIGLSCEETVVVDEQVKDPYDTSCLLVYLEDQSPEACKAAQDMDGNSCEFCELPGLLQMCLTEEQAEIGESTIGLSCDKSSNNNNNDAGSVTHNILRVDEPDLYDKSCIFSMFSAADKDLQNVCSQTLDQDGVQCLWCHLEGVVDICLTESQGDMATQLGNWCDSPKQLNLEALEEKDQAITTAAKGQEWWECLENYEEHPCNSNDGCTWCTSEVGMGFCLPDCFADTMHDCSFFACDYKEKKTTLALDAPEKSEPVSTESDFKPDPNCVVALKHKHAESACHDTLDSNGEACIWCKGVSHFGVCLSSSQADVVSKYLKCDDSHDMVAIER